MTGDQQHPSWCGRGAHCSAYTADDLTEDMHRSEPLTYRGRGHEGAVYRVHVKNDPVAMFPPSIVVEQYTFDATVMTTGEWWRQSDEYVTWIEHELDEAAGVVAMVIALLAKVDPTYLPRSPR